MQQYVSSGTVSDRTVARKLRTPSQDDLLDYRSIISPTKPGVGGFPAKLGRGDKVATYTTLDIATICCSPRRRNNKVCNVSKDLE